MLHSFHKSGNTDLNIQKGVCEMINYQSDVIVNRPVEQVYKFATDVARLDDWTEMTGTHLVSGGNLRVGSQIETTINMGPMCAFRRKRSAVPGDADHLFRHGDRLNHKQTNEGQSEATRMKTS
jgi:hypothetical protein